MKAFIITFFTILLCLTSSVGWSLENKGLMCKCIGIHCSKIDYKPIYFKNGKVIRYFFKNNKDLIVIKNKEYEYKTSPKTIVWEKKIQTKKDKKSKFYKIHRYTLHRKSLDYDYEILYFHPLFTSKVNDLKVKHKCKLFLGNLFFKELDKLKDKKQNFYNKKLIENKI